MQFNNLRMAGVVIITMALVTLASGKIIYVDDDAATVFTPTAHGHDGSLWVYAFYYLQDALAYAESVEKPVEIRVAQGVYKPDMGANQTPGDREATFQLISGVTLKGGYAGLVESDPNARDIALYETILSGDLNGDDIDVNNPDDLLNEPTRAENSYHVVIGTSINDTAVIDGFTVSGGNAERYFRNSGGGMYIGSGNLTVLNCIFSRNSASNCGGGMYNDEGNTTLTNCRFIDSYANDKGGGIYNDYNSNSKLDDCTFNKNSAGQGGGMYNDYDSSSNLAGCMFNENSAKWDGGGIYNYESDTILTNCTFNNNSADEGGGMYNYDTDMTLSDCKFSSNSAGSGAGLYNEFSNLIIDNCMFSGNSAYRDGGGMLNEGRLTLTNCTISGNLSNGQGGGIWNSGRGSNFTNCLFSGNSSNEPGGGMWNYGELTLANCTFSGNRSIYIGSRENPVSNPGGGIFSFGDSTILTNCILWGNIPDQMRGRADVSYSDIEGGWPEGGTGNIDTDPCFADAGYWDPNNTLRTGDDFWVDGDYHLKSQAGRWTLTGLNVPDPNSESWISDDVTSPCIDAGNPNNPVGDEPEPNGGRINIGAYGGTARASRSYNENDIVQYQAFNPNPADGADGIDTHSILSWSAGLNAVSHNVYFGPNSPPLYECTQTETVFDPNRDLEVFTTYYWRIDEIDSEGRTIIGEEWSFTTFGPGKGGVCFVAETPVWIDGAIAPISKVDTEQTVSCIDGICKIEEVQEHVGTFTCYDVLLESGSCITVAENHYFMAESGRWLALQELKTGTRLNTANGSIAVISVTKKPEPYVGKVYNLKIKDSDRYLVGKDAVIVRDY